MKYIVFNLFLVLFIFNHSFEGKCQQMSDTLLLKKKTIYDMNGRLVKNSTALIMMKDAPEAFQSMNKAIKYQNIGRTFIYAGSLLLIPIWLSDNVSDKLLLGGAMISMDLLGIIIASGYKKHTKEAILLYNNKITNRNLKYSMSVKFGVSLNHCSVMMCF